MKVLVGCEESQEITKAFRAKGHEAYSCDLKSCSGGHPEWHIQGDIRSILLRDSVQSILHDNTGSDFDIFIVHPLCTDICVSGARWFSEKRKSGQQRAAIEFFLQMANCNIHSIAIENPIGIMSGGRQYLKKYYPDLYEKAKSLPQPQYIQPYEYGHPETKKTCLWLKNLPKLIPTNNVYDEMMKLPKNKRNRIHYMPPSEERSTLRAKTYSGWAEAMADQWG
jgi:hypothetical protein